MQQNVLNFTEILKLEKDCYGNINDFTYYYFLFDFFSIYELSTFLSLNFEITKNLLENENFWKRKNIQYFHSLNSLRFEVLNYFTNFWNDEKSLQFENLCNGKELKNISNVIVDSYSLEKSRLQRECKNQWIIVKCLYLLENVNFFTKLKFFKKIKISKNFLIFRFFTNLFKTKRYHQNIFYCLTNDEIPNDFKMSTYFRQIYDIGTNDNEEEIKLQYKYIFTTNFLQTMKQKLKLTNDMLMHYSFRRDLSERSQSRKELFKKENLFLLLNIDFSLDRSYYSKYVQLCPCVSIKEEEKNEKNEKNKLIVYLFEEYVSNVNSYKYIYPDDITKIINHLDNFFTVMIVNNIGFPLFEKYSPKISAMDYILALSRMKAQNNYYLQRFIGQSSYFKSMNNIDDIYQSLTDLINNGITKSACKIKNNLLLIMKEKNDSNDFNWREFCNEMNLKYPTRKEMERFLIWKMTKIILKSTKFNGIPNGKVSRCYNINFLMVNELCESKIDNSTELIGIEKEIKEQMKQLNMYY
ncbi:hypothetical protein ABK040_003525 [Willaertia magna]